MNNKCGHDNVIYFYECLLEKFKYFSIYLQRMSFFLHHLGYIIQWGRLVTCFIDKQSQNKIEFSF